MTPPFSALGKQVLVDGSIHYADARDPACAETIVGALNAQIGYAAALDSDVRWAVDRHDARVQAKKWGRRRENPRLILHALSALRTLLHRYPHQGRGR